MSAGNGCLEVFFPTTNLKKLKFVIKTNKVLTLMDSSVILKIVEIPTVVSLYQSKYIHKILISLTPIIIKYSITSTTGKFQTKVLHKTEVLIDNKLR